MHAQMRENRRGSNSRPPAPRSLKHVQGVPRRR